MQNVLPASIRRLLLVGAISMVIFIIMGSLATGHPEQIKLDKIMHGAGYAALGILVTTALPTVWYLPAFFVFSCMGLLLECFQALTIRNRNFELNDFYANIIGLGLGCLIGWFICCIWKEISGLIANQIESKRLHTYQDGAVIFKEGDPSDFLYIVRSGKVSIINQQGKSLGFASTDELIGEMGVIENMPRSATAVSIGETILYRLDRAAIEKPILGQEQLSLGIARVLAKRLREANARIV